VAGEVGLSRRSSLERGGPPSPGSRGGHPAEGISGRLLVSPGEGVKGVEGVGGSPLGVEGGLQAPGIQDDPAPGDEGGVVLLSLAATWNPMARPSRLTPPAPAKGSRKRHGEAPPTAEAQRAKARQEKGAGSACSRCRR
jgi:hypothetical protein